MSAQYRVLCRIRDVWEAPPLSLLRKVQMLFENGVRYNKLHDRHRRVYGCDGRKQQRVAVACLHTVKQQSSERRFCRHCRNYDGRDYYDRLDRGTEAK